jgi:hypothetical protein
MTINRVGGALSFMPDIHPEPWRISNILDTGLSLHFGSPTSLRVSAKITSRSGSDIDH